MDLSHRMTVEIGADFPGADKMTVAQPGARMVLLTHEVRLLERTAERFAQQWRLLDLLRVRSGGMTPAVALLRRTSAEASD